MPNVLAVVEGKSEQRFLQQIVAPYLGARGTYLHPCVVGKLGRKGGAKPWDVVLNDLRRHHAEHPSWLITTVFDYYGLPKSWPGLAEAKKRTGEAAIDFLEAAIHAAVVEAIPTLGGRFIPYIQRHEFEALLFADGASVVSAVGADPKAGAAIDQTREQCGGCEAIDDGPETAPSKRLKVVLPKYDKAAHGVLIVQAAGLPCVRAACPRFDAWLTKLEALGAA